MKIRFTKIPAGERFVQGNKVIKTGDVIDIPKASADYFVKRGNAEAVREPSKQKSKTKQ